MSLYHTSTAPAGIINSLHDSSTGALPLFMFLTPQGKWTLRTFWSLCWHLFSQCKAVLFSGSALRLPPQSSHTVCVLRGEGQMPFAACQSNRFTFLLFRPVSSLFFLSSFCLIPFLDLCDLPLVVVIVGSGVSVMQPPGLFHGTNWVRQA